MQHLKKVIFVTGNKDKLLEAQKILSPYVSVEAHDVEIPELQGDPEEIIKEKVQFALKSQNVETPFIMEDSCLCFNALKGLPGPYIKWFIQKVGYDGLNKMLEGFEDKTAYSQTIFAYQATPEAEPILFIGRCHGKIVPPRGEKFGWPIFQPDGFEQTFAELDRDVKNSISQRGRALQQMVEYFEETK